MANWFLQQLNHFTFPPVVYKGSKFSMTWLFSLFLITAIFLGTKWFFIVVCIFLLINDISIISYGFCPFVCLLCRNVYLCTLLIFKLSLFLLLLKYKNSSIMNSRPYLDMWFASTFSHCGDCHFTFLKVPFDAQMFLIWGKCN